MGVGILLRAGRCKWAGHVSCGHDRSSFQCLSFLVLLCYSLEEGEWGKERLHSGPLTDAFTHHQRHASSRSLSVGLQMAVSSFSLYVNPQCLSEVGTSDSREGTLEKGEAIPGIGD